MRSHEIYGGNCNSQQECEGGIVVKTILVNNISCKSQCLLLAKEVVSSSNL